MRVALSLVCALAVLSPPPTFGDPKTPSQIGEPVPAVSCDPGGTQYSDPAFYSIPDCDGPVIMGPISASGYVVAVAVDMDHTWAGDINLRLEYDADCNGVPEAGAQLMCRAGMFDPSCPTSGCCGCSDDLGGVYVFRDDPTLPILGDPYSGCSGGAAAPGCYRPVTALSGLPYGGGCWRLVGQDGACSDMFYVYWWAIYVQGGIGPSWGACCFENGDCQYIAYDACTSAGGIWHGRVFCDDACSPTAVEPITWGALKHTPRD